MNTAATQATAAAGHARGTPAYMAPELLESNTFTEKTDVYAMAVVIWEVLDGGRPFAGMNAIQIGMQVMVKRARPPAPEGAPADLVALMERCWAHDPDARPTFDAIKGWLTTGAAPLSPQGSSLSPSPSLEELRLSVDAAADAVAPPSFDDDERQRIPDLGASSPPPERGVRQLMVEVPAGAAPGATVQLQAPDGTMLQLAIPEGATPGSRFLAQY